MNKEQESNQEYRVEDNNRSSVVNKQDSVREEFHIFSFHVMQLSRFVVFILLGLIIVVEGVFFWFEGSFGVMFVEVMLWIFLWVLTLVVLVWGNNVRVTLRVGDGLVELERTFASMFSSRNRLVLNRVAHVRDVVMFDRGRVRLPNLFVVSIGVGLEVMSEGIVLFRDDILNFLRGHVRNASGWLGASVFVIVILGFCVVIAGLFFLGFEGFYFRLRFGFPGHFSLISWSHGVFSFDDSWVFWGWGDDAVRLYQVGEKFFFKGEVL